MLNTRGDLLVRLTLCKRERSGKVFRNVLTRLPDYVTQLRDLDLPPDLQFPNLWELLK
jgi:hypothetical protein